MPEGESDHLLRVDDDRAREVELRTDGWHQGGHALRDELHRGAGAHRLEHRLEGCDDLLRGTYAGDRIALQHSGDEFIEPRRLAAVEQRNRVMKDGVERGSVVVASEELLAREGLPEHHAERPEVRARVDGERPNLLRGHVRDLALDLAGAGETDVRGALGDAEIEELHAAVAGDENIVRGDVAMDEPQRAPIARPSPMRVSQTPRGAREDGHAHGGAEALPTRHALLEQPQEVGALQALHHDDREPLVLADLEHLDDV